MRNPPSSAMEDRVGAFYAAEPSADFIDRLWKDLQSRPSTTPVRRAAAPPAGRWLRPALAGILLFTLIGLFFAATPQGRALARQIIHFFQTTTEKYFPPSFEPAPTPVPAYGIPAGLVPVPLATAVDKPMCGETISLVSSTFPCLLMNAQADAGFELKTFPSSRLNVQFSMLGMEPGTHAVSIAFRGEDAWYIITQGMGIFPTPCEKPWCAVPQDAVQETSVGPYPAEYVAGNWVSQINAGMWWYSNQPLYQLAWMEGRRWFLIQTILPTGGGEKEFLIDLAENLVAISQGIENLAGADTPTVEQQAGFDVLEPAWIPKDFRMIGAGFYQNDDALVEGYALDVTDMVTITYGLYTQGRFAAYLTFYEMPAAIPADLLWEFDQSEPTTAEEVRIAGMPGQFLANAKGQALVWTGGNLKLMMTFSWIPAYGGRIAKSDLIAVAGSLR
jgi:hypothetical protein